MSASRTCVVLAVLGLLGQIACKPRRESTQDAGIVAAASANTSAQAEPVPRAPTQKCWPSAALAKVPEPKLDKLSFTQSLLAMDGGTADAFIHLDARHAGVVVPAYVAKEAHLVLQIGNHMANPIPDLVLDTHGFSGTLSFYGQPFTCTVPWSAVFAVINDSSDAIYTKDIPPEARCPE